ncbi:MAG: tetratricopeptide repeat protein [bacterium]
MRKALSVSLGLALCLSAGGPLRGASGPSDFTGEAGVLYAQGSRYFLRGHLAAAQTCFERLARERPSSAQAWYWLGLARAARGNYRGGEDAQRLATGHDANFGPAYCALGLDLRQTGQRDMADWAVRRALSLMPRYAGAWNLLGALEQDAHRFDDARRCYEGALRLDPGYAEAWFNLGQLWELQGRDGLALDDYTRSLRAKPDNADVRLRRAELWQDKGLWEAARRDYDACLNLQGWAPEAWWGLRRVDLAEGRADAARRALKHYFEEARRRDQEQVRLADRNAARGMEDPSPYEPDAPGLPDFTMASGERP